MNRTVGSALVILGLSFWLGVSSAEAESAFAPDPDRFTVVEVGVDTLVSKAEVRTDGRVRFQNRPGAATRVIFASGDVDDVECVSTASYSRRGQYLLNGGEDLFCTFRPGSYRYMTITQAHGSVQKVRSRLRVRD